MVLFKLKEKKKVLHFFELKVFTSLDMFFTIF